MALIASMFGFNWHRFSNPAVIVGLVLICLGISLLIIGNKLAIYITAKAEQKGKKVKDFSLIFKLFAAAIVVAGALTAVLTA